jgi:hypothetical protein
MMIIPWKRWLKALLGIDPLVGMYFVTYAPVIQGHQYWPNMGKIIGRIETGAAPKYLLHYFCEEGWPADDNLISDLLTGTYSFYESRTEAQKWYAWRSNNAARQRQRLAVSTAAGASWEPPTPERPN